MIFVDVAPGLSGLSADPARIYLKLTLAPQKSGPAQASGTWGIWDYSTLLGNKGFAGTLYSKSLPPRVCGSQEEAWAERCDKGPDIGNQCTDVAST